MQPLFRSAAASGLDDPAHLACRISLVDGRAGHEDLRPGLHHQRRGLGGDATVHLNGEIGHLLQAANLLDHLGDKGLSPKSRVHAHHEHVVEVGQRPLDELRWGGGVQGGAGLAAAVPDHLQGPVQVTYGLRLHGDADHPGLYKRFNEVVRVLHHEVGVHWDIYRFDERGGYHRADGQVRDEVVVHRVEVDQLGPAPLGPAHFLGEVREVRREYRGSAHHPTTKFAPKRHENASSGPGPGHSTENTSGETGVGYSMSSKILNIGRLMAVTMTPTIAPTTKIISGFLIAGCALTAAPTFT